MSVVIPFPNQFPDFRQDVTLEGIAYRFRIRYSSRDDSWVLSISSLDDTVLAAGLKLIQDFELIEEYPDRGLPPGSLLLTKTIPDMDAPRPNRDNVGQNELNEELPYQLIYLTQNEVSEIREADLDTILETSIP